MVFLAGKCTGCPTAFITDTHSHKHYSTKSSTLFVIFLYIPVYFMLETILRPLSLNDIKQSK